MQQIPFEPKENTIIFTLRISGCLLTLLLLVGCSYQSARVLPSKNYSPRVQYLVLHYTADNYQQSLDSFTQAPNASAHYLIPSRFDSSYTASHVTPVSLVEESNAAWHAGKSYWQGRDNLNLASIGIELVNQAHCSMPILSSTDESELHSVRLGPLCQYPDYDPEQIKVLVTLIKQILQRHPGINATRIVGHSDIAPTRKLDPGPRFPWYALYQAGIGAWYDNDTVIRYYTQLQLHPLSTELLQQALHRYGYDVAQSGRIDSVTQAAVRAFQMHFLPWQVTELADARTQATLMALLEKYFPEHAEDIWQQYLAVSVANSNIQQTTGQLSQEFPFPDAQQSERTLVNQRLNFHGYAGQGRIYVEGMISADEAPIFADIQTNGQSIKQHKFNPYQGQYLSIAGLTRNGINHLAITDIQPATGRLNIRIDYPQLIRKNVDDSDQRFGLVDALINAEVAKGFPGAVLLVVKDGRVIKHSAYGYARKYNEQGVLLTHPVPMRKDTMFDLASNTKMFATNLALMKLVSEGKIQLDDPVTDYLPEYRGGGRETRTIADLLSHSAGYPADVYFYRPDNQFGEAFFSQNKAQTTQLLLHAVPFTQPTQGNPRYSDIDYMLLGLLVEAVTGQALDNYVESEIYAPLGVNNIEFNPLLKGRFTSEFAATEIDGNSRGGRVEFPNIRRTPIQGQVHDEKAFYSMGGVSGHAGLFADAADLGVLVQVLLNRGGYGSEQVFRPDVLDQFTRPNYYDESFGLGWRRAGNGGQSWLFGPYASPQAYGHTGWTGTLTLIDPAYNLGIVLLTNVRHSKIEGEDEDAFFTGKSFETGKYGSVISLIYEALITPKSEKH